jgi:hypothetical protein
MPAIKNIFLNKYFVLALWFGLSLIAVVKQVLAHAINNYYIYKEVFFNLIHQRNLYIPYPAHYFDTNHYGPFFGLIIAPFAIMPDAVGVVLWVMANAFVLYWAITQLPVHKQKQTAILLICAHELMTSSYNVQINPLITALVIMAFVFIRKEKDFWAALMIMVGTYIKLYGIVGLAFFFFSEHKLKFIAGLIFWGVLFLLLPMLVSSYQFVLQCYHDWYKSLSEKDTQNALASMQDISVKGMIHRIFKINLAELTVLLPGVFLFLSSYLRFRSFKNIRFQLLILASTLIFPIIFSSSSESPTYIIAFAGVAVWFMILPRPVSPFEVFLLVFAIIVTSLAPSDLLPKPARDFIRDYGLKALPCFVIWLRIVYETLITSFAHNEQPLYSLAHD